MIPGQQWGKSSWTSADRHRLDARLRIDATRLTHKIVNAVQIHDGGDDVIQVQYRDGVLGISHNDGESWELLDGAYTGGTFDLRVLVTGLGDIAVTYDRSKTVTIPKTGTGWYWKVGCYPNTGGANPQRPEWADAYCDVTVYALAIDPA